MSMYFAKKLKQAREKAGISQKAFAELVGISDRQVSMYERGLSVPRGSTLSKISTVLGVKPDFFEVINDGFMFTNLFVNRPDLQIFKNDGDRLIPYYEDGDKLIVDTEDKDLALYRHVGKKNIFLMKINNDIYAHHLGKIKNSDLILVSYPNKEYPVFTMSQEEVKNSIIGRIIGSIE